MLRSDVVTASTINTYALSANQITSGYVSADRLDARVVTSDNLSSRIASISDGIVTTGVQITGSYGLQTLGGVHQSGSGYNNSFNGQTVFSGNVQFVGDVLFSGFRRPVLGGTVYACVINGAPATISVTGAI